MKLQDFLRDKDILVTGGCGSIGSNIVKKLVDYPIKRVRVFDNNETAQFYLQKELKNSGKMRALMGDVRDLSRLDFAMKGVDIVIHAAALKHVGMCEYNPSEAVATNVIGTQNVLDTARANGVKKVLSISTDKAVNPINTMGATKLLSEKLVLNANYGENNTKFSCVRFGNVLNSNGSVIPIFKEQIKRGGPVTITSEKMTRFYMFIEDAVDLILESLLEMNGREIFILKMNTLNVLDLAEVMVEMLGPKYGFDPKKIKIEKIGVQNGEKTHEVLLFDEEKSSLIEKRGMYILNSIPIIPHSNLSDIKVDSVEVEIDSAKSKIVSKNELKEVLKKLGI